MRELAMLGATAAEIIHLGTITAVPVAALSVPETVEHV
jgi:hypothetical protein